MQDGQYTRTVYSLIKERQFAKAVELLEPISEALPGSRAALSLLGHCYYHQGHYQSACDTYALLTRFVPELPEYRLYHAQALYKAGELEEALRIADSMTALQDQVEQLKVAIRYAAAQLQDCRQMLRAHVSQGPDMAQNEGCILYREGKHSEARQSFYDAMELSGPTPALLYNVALCSYSLNEPGEALRCVARIIDKGMREHPELSTGLSQDAEAMSVGNTQVLQDAALIEAFNLKAAISYQLKDIAAAKQALAEMPPRDIGELDPCTLHNRALIGMDTDPEEGFRTLSFLINNPPFPPEAFANLLLLYVKPPHNMHDVAADTIAQHPDYAQQYLTPELLAYLDAVALKQSAPEEAYQQFERMGKTHIDQMRLLTKIIQDARHASNTALLAEKVQEFDSELNKYIPILMAQAHIYWEIGQYSSVIKVFNQSREFAAEHEMWKLNVAHAYFMMESPANKGEDSLRDNFQKAIDFYEPAVTGYKDSGSLLDVPAMVVSNLCVSYIMNEKNHEAEEIMKQLEREEHAALEDEPDKQVLHSCIVNLVIGTLYCAKQNYEFGMSRVMKALEPLEQKLEADTWFYAKRCLVALVDGLAKHMICLNDSAFDDVIQFLDKVSEAGTDIHVTASAMDKSSRSIRDEAQIIRSALMTSRFVVTSI